MTKKTEYKEFGNLRLIDTQGFGDPNAYQYILWNRLVKDIHDWFCNDGLQAIVVPCMFPESGRIEQNSIDIIFQLLMTLTIVHPNFDR